MINIQHANGLKCTKETGMCIAGCYANDDAQDDCKDALLECPIGRDCSLYCDNTLNRRRLLDHSQMSSEPPKQTPFITLLQHPTISAAIIPHRRLQLVHRCYSTYYGCCSSELFCPVGHYCEIDCRLGCNGLTIYAEESSSLRVYGCGGVATYDRHYCTNMKIYCPRNGRSGTKRLCKIEGDGVQYDMINSNIYTEEGFGDVNFTAINLVRFMQLL